MTHLVQQDSHNQGNTQTLPSRPITSTRLPFNQSIVLLKTDECKPSRSVEMLSKTGHLFSLVIPDALVTEKWGLDEGFEAGGQSGVEGLLKLLLTGMAAIQHNQESLNSISAALDEKIQHLNCAVQLMRDIAAGKLPSSGGTF